MFRGVAAGGAQETPLDAVERLDLAYREKWALAEELITGLDFWDFYEKHRDTTEWFEVSVVAGTTKTPVFVVGQYVPRGPFMRWYFELKVTLLALVRLFVNGEDKAKDVLQLLLAAFRFSGRELALTSPRPAAGPSANAEMRSGKGGVV